MDGYWNFVAGVLLLLAVVYVTSKGQLPRWINLLSFVPAATPQVGGSGAANSAQGGAANSQAPVNVGALNAVSGGMAGSAGTQIAPAGQSLIQGLVSNPMGVIKGLLGSGQ